MHKTRLTCPRCKKQFKVRTKLQVICPDCGAITRYVEDHWEWEFPSEPESLKQAPGSRETNPQWSYPTYLEAKVAMIQLWTLLGDCWPTCAICGEKTRHPHAHHLHLSRRYKIAKYDLRNIVPVCNESVSNCHQRAHGKDKATAIQRQYLVLGRGDAELGKKIVEEALIEWNIH
jgi:hypothetical protein